MLLDKHLHDRPTILRKPSVAVPCYIVSPCRSHLSRGQRAKGEGHSRKENCSVHETASHEDVCDVLPSSTQLDYPATARKSSRVFLAGQVPALSRPLHHAVVSCFGRAYVLVVSRQAPRSHLGRRNLRRYRMVVLAAMPSS